MDQSCDPQWPPGTIKLQLLLDNDRRDAQIILQPRPTDDPNDPLNWPKWQKSINFALACFYAMMVYAFVNATGVTWGPMGEELNFSFTLLTNTYAIGCATLALGAPMLIPFALKFGSRPVYVISSVAQLAIAIWAANTQTGGDWWGVNALQCWLGALCEVLVQLTIADVFFVHQRGLLNSIYIWVMNVGGYLAVVAAGFITLDQGWRWVWWWCAILFGVQFIAFLFGFEETKYTSARMLDNGAEKIDSNPPAGRTPIEKSDEKHASYDRTSIDAEAGRDEEVLRRLSTIQINPTLPRKTYIQKLSLLTSSPGPWSKFFRHTYQPFLILGTIPGVLFCSLCYAVMLAWATVMTASLSTYMIIAPYNFTSAEIGLMNLPPFIGATLGSLICGPVSDRLVLRLASRNNGIYEPEMRFWVFLPFVPFAIAGAFWFGNALDSGAPWPMVAVAYGLNSFGSAPVQAIALTYMVDAYNDVIGDALTALTFVRNLFSTIFVFAMPAWIAAVGLANVFNTIGAIGLFILSFAGVFIWRGKQFRVKTARIYKYYAERQFEARPL